MSTQSEVEMDRHRDESKAVDPTLPHAFVERLNVPFADPRPAGPAQIAPEFPFRRAGTAEECAICGRSRSDRLHRASEEAAEAEEGRWPV
jgi:hypothetical protein